MIMRCSSLLLVGMVTLGISEFCSAGPFMPSVKSSEERKSCTSGMACISVSLAGVYMKLWSHRLKSGGHCQPVPREGEKCLYKLQSASVHFISAKHTTPVKRYVDDINFRLVSYGFFSHCHVSAMSVSETWYAVTDHGTNYCNLYNLMEGSRLTEAPGYKEITSDFLCTQRSSANCTVY